MWVLHYPEAGDWRQNFLSRLLERSGQRVSTSREEGPRGEDREGLYLTPPEGGYELYRHTNAGSMKTKGWHGYYWARRNEAGDYEIRSVPVSSGEPSVPGGVFPREGFEEHYESSLPTNR